jgi:hypothetical protein
LPPEFWKVWREVEEAMQRARDREEDLVEITKLVELAKNLLRSWQWRGIREVGEGDPRVRGVY